MVFHQNPLGALGRKLSVTRERMSRGWFREFQDSRVGALHVKCVAHNLNLRLRVAIFSKIIEHLFRGIASLGLRIVCLWIQIVIFMPKLIYV